jgi:signal transduction histidine kinase
VVVTTPRGERPRGRCERVGRAVAQLNAAVRDGRDRTEVLDLVCGYGRALTRALAATVMTVDPDGVLVVRAIAGRGAVCRRGERLAVADTLAGTALHGREPVSASLRHCRYRHEQALAAAGFGRVIYLPIPGYGSVAGVLGVGYRRSGAVAAWEVGLLETLAAIAGLVPPVPERDPDPADPPDGSGELAVAGERARLARELHDSVVQTLYGISLGAGTAGELLHHDPVQAQRSIAWIQETAAAGMTDLRDVILRLRPAALPAGGLVPALGHLLDTLQALHGCRTSAMLDAEPPTSADVRQALYRIAQEAVQNAVKHARAGHVSVRLFGEDTDVVLEVVDDGQGFRLDREYPGRLGIRSMRERAEGVGGRLDIVSGPGTGTSVRARLPADV